MLVKLVSPVMLMLFSAMIVRFPASSKSDAALMSDTLLIVIPPETAMMSTSVAAKTLLESIVTSPLVELMVALPSLASNVDVPEERLIRSDQLAGLVLRMVGVEADTDAAGGTVLASDETFTSETGWRTYRRGRWKSAWRRGGGPAHLFDLVLGEHLDRALLHPDVLAEHRTRIAEIAEQLEKKDGRPPTTLEPGDHERLRALGYAE